MSDVFDIYTIIFLALAVFIFLRLRSVLGQRTGRERPPYAPDGLRRPVDTVVSLPPRPAAATEPPPRPVEAGQQPPAERWKDIAEMIVTAFAAGDRRQLRNLLSREVFDGFDAAIGERERKSETAETRFVSIDGSTITAAELRNKTAQITVRFISKLVSATRDRSGAVIDGSADKVTDVTDVWTFARDISSRDPNWKVVATEAGQ
jgi:predicted lipid-binding transport protein (Tim44 family)